MHIDHNTLREDGQVLVEQVEQSADKQDEGMKNAEIDDKGKFLFVMRFYLKLEKYQNSSWYMNSEFSG